MNDNPDPSEAPAEENGDEWIPEEADDVLIMRHLTESRRPGRGEATKSEPEESSEESGSDEDGEEPPPELIPDSPESSEATKESNNG